jgi:hypothetical protein
VLFRSPGELQTTVAEERDIVGQLLELTQDVRGDQDRPAFSARATQRASVSEVATSRMRIPGEPGRCVSVNWRTSTRAVQ